MITSQTLYSPWLCSRSLLLEGHKWKDNELTTTYVFQYWSLKKKASTGKDVEQLEVVEIHKWNGHFQFLIELNTCVAYYSNATHRHGLISKDIKFYGYTKTCTQLLITVLFIIAPNFKQSKCPSVVSIDEGWYISMQWNTIS